MQSHLEILLNKLKNKKVAFLGLARTNLPLIKLLSKYKKDYGIALIALDKFKNSNDPNVKEILRLGISLRLGPNCLRKLDMDIIFRSPGVYFNSTELNLAKQKGIEVTSEIEEFFDIHPCKIIAVTGSDGKTTTTSIIGKILENSGYKVHLGGNIGNPILDKIEEIKNTDIAVLELSSFQLISMKKSPDVSVITNISPNHLNVHKDMEEYISAKKNIILNQGKDSIAVINFESEKKYHFSQFTKAKILFFGENLLVKNEPKKCSGSGLHNCTKSSISDIKLSRLENLTDKSNIFESKDYSFIDNGATVVNGRVQFITERKSKFIIEAKDIALKGSHNIENCLAAICAIYGLSSHGAIVKTLQEFKGVPHRMEFVGTYNGVTYINDSIATTPTRTIKGALSFIDEKVILIAGGYDKNVPFDDLGDKVLKKVKVLILMGNTAFKIRNAVFCSAKKRNSKEVPEIFFAKNMLEAVKIAKACSSKGDHVLLSPACASLDMYKDFEERGKTFIKNVLSINQK